MFNVLLLMGVINVIVINAKHAKMAISYQQMKMDKMLVFHAVLHYKGVPYAIVQLIVLNVNLAVLFYKKIQGNVYVINHKAICL